MKNNFEKLDAWKEAHELVLTVYKITKKFPKEEKFRLTDQMCRSASSVAANLVEGSARSYKKEFTQFAFMSKGSLEETKYHLLLAKDLGYLSEEQYKKFVEKSDRVGKLINGLINYLKSSNGK